MPPRMAENDTIGAPGRLVQVLSYTRTHRPLTHMLHNFPKLLRLWAGDVVEIEVSITARRVNIDLAE